MLDSLTYKPYGERSILIEWESKIDVSIHKDIIRYKQIIQSNSTQIQSVIVGYHSLLVSYKGLISSFTLAIKELKECYLQETVLETVENFVWEIPVCYDREFGIDLEVLAKQSGLTIEEIIRLHTKPIYQVYFIGFLPGFMYLGGLDKQIHFNRKQTPRLKVPKGSVAIGGSQTGVYPQESAGGWNIIGNTPISFFDRTKKRPCFIKAGDQICFQSITKEVHKEMMWLDKKGIYRCDKKQIG